MAALIDDSEIAKALVNVPGHLMFQGEQRKLTMKQLDELISYVNPPSLVITVMEGLCAAIGYDNIKSGDWLTIKKILDASRKKGHLKLIGVKAEDIPKDAWVKIERACAIDQSKINKASSAAASTATFLRGLLATKPETNEPMAAVNPLVDDSSAEKAPVIEDKGDDWSTISEPVIKLVEKLNRQTLNELKSYCSPPKWIQECLSGIICCLFGQPESWENARKLLTNVSCIQRLLNFNPYLLTAWF